MANTRLSSGLKKFAHKRNGVPGVPQNAMLSIDLQNSDLVADDIVNEQEIARPVEFNARYPIAIRSTK